MVWNNLALCYPYIDLWPMGVVSVGQFPPVVDHQTLLCGWAVRLSPEPAHHLQATDARSIQVFVTTAKNLERSGDYFFGCYCYAGSGQAKHECSLGDRWIDRFCDIADECNPDL